MMDQAARATTTLTSQSLVKGGQMLTFGLAEETYGVEILRVREIRGWTPVTTLPHSPPHVLGVLNLRGAIVPIIDLRRRFALQSVAFTVKTVVIVLTLKTVTGPQDCGVVVDRVADVVDVDATGIKPPPPTHQGVDLDFIDGLATTDDGLLILLNLDSLIAEDVNRVMTKQ